MNTIFWLTTFLLLLISFAFILPWLRVSVAMLLVGGVLAISSYGLYLIWGSPQQLTQYYSISAQFSRIKQAEVRELLADFRKEEYRLRVRLEKDPNDQDAQWRLLDVLAIKALYHHEYADAMQYWEHALAKMPNNKATEHEKLRIRGVIEKIREPLH